MIPEISASKVAGLIGLHKYQTSSEIMYELFLKDKDTKEKILSVERENGRSSFNVVLNKVLKDRSVQDCISAGVAAASKTSDVPSVLEEVEKRASVILSLRCSDIDSEARGRIAEEIRGMVSKRRGIANENTILDQYEVDRDVKVVERNTKMCRKVYSNFKLCGRTDGYVPSENRIVDSKERTRVWDTVPIYDEIQLRCYMDMTGVTESELVERFPNGQTRHTKFLNDAEKWKAIEKAVSDAVNKMNAILENPEELKRIVFENTI
jgi:hypothetical protein